MLRTISLIRSRSLSTIVVIICCWILYVLPSIESHRFRIDSRRRREGFQETSVRITAEETIRTDEEDTDESEKWRQIAEDTIKKQRNETRGYMNRIRELQLRVSKAEKRAAALQDQLLTSEQKQQQAFVDQIRKEERLRQKQEHFMSAKLSELSTNARNRLSMLQEEAQANVTAVESLLRLEHERLKRANAASNSLQQQIQKWRETANRATELGKGRAEAMERLRTMRLKFNAAARVAERWRNESMRALALIGGPDFSGSSESSAGNSPDDFESALREIESDRDRQQKEKDEKTRKQKALAADYPYASWELNSVHRQNAEEDETPSSKRAHHVQASVFPSSNPLGFLKTALPLTSISDMHLRPSG